MTAVSPVEASKFSSKNTSFRALIREEIISSQFGSNFNFPYPDPQRVQEVFKAIRVNEINDKTLAAILTYLYPKIFPNGFFDSRSISLHTHDIEDLREGVVVTYENSFGWGKQGEWGYPAYRERPEFSDHDLTIRLKTTEEIYLPQEGFNDALLGAIILDDKEHLVTAANLNTSPFFYLPRWKEDCAKVGLSPRDPTYGVVSEAVPLLKDVLSVLKSAQPEFEEYTKLLTAEAKVKEAQEKLNGTYEIYVAALGGETDPLADSAVKNGEVLGKSSLEQRTSCLKTNMEDLLVKASQRFEANGLRDRLVEYFTQPTNYSLAKRKDRIDLAGWDE